MKTSLYGYREDHFSNHLTRDVSYRTYRLIRELIISRRLLYCQWEIFLPCFILAAISTMPCNLARQAFHLHFMSMITNSSAVTWELKILGWRNVPHLDLKLQSCASTYTGKVRTSKLINIAIIYILASPFKLESSLRHSCVILFVYLDDLW